LQTEVNRLCERVGTMPWASGVDDDPEEPLYESVKGVVLKAGEVSTSFVQRKFGIGYSRAARLVDMLEERGVIEAGRGAKPRVVRAEFKSKIG
jgi:DNA segregation ATPase FtsK/SpoIIIE, S-DNA-T family